MNQPTFDLEPRTEWHEVPQARFLSWSPAMQDAYCRARDLDSAEQTDDDWWLLFYHKRSEGYR